MNDNDFWDKDEKASEKYVRRDEIMEKYYDDLERNYDIVAYYGYAGIGKSSLEELLLEELEERSDGNYFVMYNFEKYNPTSFVDFIFWLRYKIEKKYPELIFPYFDTLSTVYLEKVPNYNPLLDKDAKTENNDESKAFYFVLEVLKKLKKYGDLILPPELNKLLEIAEKGMDVFKEVKSFSDIGIKVMDIFWKDEQIERFKKEAIRRSANEIENKFAKAFVKDLNNWSSTDSKELTIILDALDYCDVTKEKKAILSEIKTSLLNEDISNVKWILTSRESLEDYRDNQRVKLIQLTGLNEEEALEFLQRDEGLDGKAIKEEDIARQIIKITEGNPLYLDLCKKIYNSIDNPTVNDFENERFSKLSVVPDLEDYVDRIIKYLNGDQIALLRAFSFLRKWKENDLKDICKASDFVAVQTGTDEYNWFLESSMIEKEGDVYTIQRAIAECVYANKGFTDKMKNDLECAYLELIKKRIQNDEAKDYYCDNFISLLDNYNIHSDNEKLILEVSDLVRHYYEETNIHAMLYLDKELYLISKQNEFSKEAQIKFITNYVESSNEFRKDISSLLDKKDFNEAKERLDELMSMNEQVLDGKNPLPDSIATFGIDNLNEAIDNNRLLINEVEVFVNGLDDKTSTAYMLYENNDLENAILVLKDVIGQIEENEQKIRDFYDHEENVTNWISNKYLSLCSLQVKNNNKDDALETYERFRRLTPSIYELIVCSLDLLTELKNVNLLEAYQMRKDDYQRKVKETGMPGLVSARKEYCDYLLWCNTLFSRRRTDSENDFRNIEWLFLDLEKETDELAALMFTDSIAETWRNYMESETIPILETIYDSYLNCSELASLLKLNKPFANWEEWEEYEELRTQHVQRIRGKKKQFIETTKQLYKYDVEAKK